MALPATSDLPEKLVEAAVKAARRERSKRLGRHISVSSREWEDIGARAAAAAVVRTLADTYPSEPDTNATPEQAAELYALADAICSGEWCNCQARPGDANYPGPWHPLGDVTCQHRHGREWARQS